MLRMQLEFIRQFDADVGPVQQVLQILLIFDARTCGIAEREAAALVALREEVFHFHRVVAGDVELLANAFVPILRQRFGGLDGKAVKVEIFLVVVGFE